MNKHQQNKNINIPEEYFRALLENSFEIIGVLDKKGVVEYISESVI